MRWSNLSSRHELGLVAGVFSVVLLALPTVILGVLAYRFNSGTVAVGAGVQAMFLLVFFRAHPVWRPPVSASIVVLYLMAFVWVWLPLRSSADWAPHVAQGALLFLAVALLAVHDLTRTGAEPLRRANKWCRRIASRTQWPMQLADCRVLPEAALLRDAICDEPGPALAMLSDPRPEVQTAALGALEYRTGWRPGEAELVLKFGQQHREPAVRAAAAYALAGVGPADLVAGLAGFLRDPATDVRRAAAEALMWHADSRWPFARDMVKESLADPRLANDGAIFAGMGRLPAAAVADFVTWSSEHPPLARRAILSVVEHYHADLVASERPELGIELAAMMLNQETAPALRVELASLLRDHNQLSPDLLDRLTNLDQPAPMRLFAAELMLRINPHDPDGVDVLRGLARQPNRELAVQVAAVLQNVLGLELGLPQGNLPAPNSKPAADVARRVLAWANGAPPEVMRPTPGPRAGLPGSRHTAPGLPLRPTMVAIPPTLPPVGSRNPFMEDSLLGLPPARPPARPRSVLDEDISPLAEEEVEEEDSLLGPPESPRRSVLDDDGDVPLFPEQLFPRPSPGSSGVF